MLKGFSSAGLSNALMSLTLQFEVSTSGNPLIRMQSNVEQSDSEMPPIQVWHGRHEPSTRTREWILDDQVVTEDACPLAKPPKRPKLW